MFRNSRPLTARAAKEELFGSIRRLVTTLSDPFWSSLSDVQNRSYSHRLVCLMSKLCLVSMYVYNVLCPEWV